MIPKVELPHKTLYFAIFLETNQSEDTIPAILDVVNEINAIYKVKAVYRIHADKAPELAGGTVKE